MEKIYITGCAGEYANARFCVENEIIIGRDPQKCQIVFSAGAKGISGVHCKVHVVEGSIFLTDQSSTNGTFLENGTRLAPGMAVKVLNGGRFYLGNKQNVFGIEVVPDVQQIQPAGQPQHFFSMPHKAGRGGVSSGILVAAIAGVVILAICVIVSIANNSQRVQEAKDEAYRAQMEANRVQNEADLERYKSEQAQKELEEEQNKGVLEKTLDAAEGWLDFLP